MKYKVIKENFGGMPLAGFLMEIINMLQDKDGCDSIAFLKKIDDYTNNIYNQSEAEEFKEKEFFFVLSTDDEIFGLDFYVGYTIAELENKEYVDGWVYPKVKYFRMYTTNEDWGLDEIELYDETSVNVAEINIPKVPIDIFNDDMSGELIYKCPNCEQEFKANKRCPECGQSILLTDKKENNNMEYEVMETMVCECYDNVYEKWFEITKGMGRFDARIRILNAIYNEEPNGNDILYVGFEEEICDVNELSQCIITRNIDKIKECELAYLIEFNSETGTHYIKRIQFEKEEYDLVQVYVTRERTIREKAQICIAVPRESDLKSMQMAEEYVSNNYSEYDNLNWEEDDENVCCDNFEIDESDIADTDTLENIESANNIDATID